MTGQGPSDFDRELTELRARVTALREAASAVGAPLTDLVQACLTELDYAVGRLNRAGGSADDARRRDSPSGERRLLDALFRAFPLPGLVLGESGTIRRANAAAADLLGVPVSQLTGKPVTVFVELPARALFRTALSAAARSDEAADLRTRVLRQGSAVDAHVAFTPLPAGSRMLLATFSTAAPGTAPPADPPAGDPAQGDGVVARALDLVGGLARLLLDPRTADPLARAVELIARTLGDLVIIDLVEDGRFRQAAVAGPSGSTGAEVILVSGYDPAEGLRRRVLETGHPVLTELIEDDHALGDAAEGVVLLDAVRAVSLMCVPIRGAFGIAGTLTCIRQEGRAVHGFWDLRCLEEAAAQLGLVLPPGRTGGPAPDRPDDRSRICEE